MSSLYFLLASSYSSSVKSLNLFDVGSYLILLGGNGLLGFLGSSCVSLTHSLQASNIICISSSVKSEKSFLPIPYAAYVVTRPMLHMHLGLRTRSSCSPYPFSPKLLPNFTASIPLFQSSSTYGSTSLASSASSSVSTCAYFDTMIGCTVPWEYIPVAMLAATLLLFERLTPQYLSSYPPPPLNLAPSAIDGLRCRCDEELPCQ